MNKTNFKDVQDMYYIHLQGIDQVWSLNIAIAREELGIQFSEKRIVNLIDQAVVKAMSDTYWHGLEPEEIVKHDVSYTIHWEKENIYVRVDV